MRALWDTPLAAPVRPDPDAATEAAYRQAEANGRRAAEALYRCRRFVGGWLAHADPEIGLIPRNLGNSRDFWNGRDSAADNYPFMVLTCALTDRALFEGRMLEMLRTETRLTCRVDRLPDDYSFSGKGWRREKLDQDAIIFDGAEYVKDGLIPITEWLGPSPWSERAIGILDDIWTYAPIETPFGRIPTLNFEVNGDLLQACARLFWFTGERKYLDWAIRLGDYYLLGDHHPTRDAKELSIEGAITLINREPVASAAEWIDTEIRTMWAKQKADGVIEGWHGDGNSARTSILSAGTETVQTGRVLQEGLAVELKAGEERRLRVSPAGS